MAFFVAIEVAATAINHLTEAPCSTIDLQWRCQRAMLICSKPSLKSRCLFKRDGDALGLEVVDQPIWRASK